MEKVEYTSEIVSLIQKGEKLEAIAEIRKNYSISLVEAKNMVNTYKGGEGDPLDLISMIAMIKQKEIEANEKVEIKSRKESKKPSELESTDNSDTNNIKVVVNNNETLSSKLKTIPIPIPFQN